MTYKLILKDASGTAVPPTIDPYTVPAAGNAYIPLAGTAAGSPVTGLIYHENTGIDKEFVVGITTGLGIDDFIIAAQGSNVANANIYLNIDLSSWQFQSTGEVLMPDVDYSTFNDLAMVTKEYVDNTAASGVPANTFLELIGTDPSYPITGTVGYDFGTDEQWSFGAIFGGVGWQYTGGGTSGWAIYYGANIALGVGEDGNITTNPSFDCAVDGDPETLTPKDYVDNLARVRSYTAPVEHSYAIVASGGGASGQSGVVSCPRTGLGTYVATFETAAITVNHNAVVVTPGVGTAIGAVAVPTNTTQCTITLYNAAGALVDAAFTLHRSARI